MGIMAFKIDPTNEAAFGTKPGVIQALPTIPSLQSAKDAIAMAGAATSHLLPSGPSATDLSFGFPKREASPPLENLLQQTITVLQALAANEFDQHLSPNEPNPKDIQALLANMAPGYIVSTGTERSFADLILSDEKLCKGLIILDINPKVKAYMDFAILLLRLSKSRNEFLSLCQKPVNPFEYHNRLAKIRSLIEESDLSLDMNNYYNSNLQAMAETYFSVERWWDSRYGTDPHFFAGVRYNEDDQLFAKLQRYAKGGNIITITGSINELGILHDLPISVIDTSNIYEYSLVGPKGCGSSHPKIIWTEGVFTPDTPVRYHSYTHEPLTPDDEREFDELLRRILPQKTASSSYVFTLKLLLDESWRDSVKLNESECMPCASYSKITLKMLREYCERFYYFSETERINMFEEIDQLKQRSAVQIQQMIADPLVERFLPQLVLAGDQISLSTYMAFMSVPGWKEEFEKIMPSYSGELKNLCRRLNDEELLEQFVEIIGEERLVNVIRRCGFNI